MPSKRVGVAVAAQVAAASLLAGLAVVNGASGGEHVITFLCVALALSFAVGAVVLSRRPLTSPFADHLHTWVPVLAMFVAGYLLSGIGVAVFVAVAGGGAWLAGRSAGRRLGR